LAGNMARRPYCDSEMETFLLSVCVSAVLIFIAWYAAKRDLNATAARAQSPSLEEMRELRETVEGLIAVLEQKAAEIEDRLQDHFDRLAAFEQDRPVAIPAVVPDHAEPTVLSRAFELLDQGNDPRTVAQMTVLTVAEIETAARMKELRTGRR